MKIYYLLFSCMLLVACKSKQNNTTVSVAASEVSTTEQPTNTTDFTMVFASCNDQERPQPLWKPILENGPQVFIWGGDNIYADTADMQKMEADYNKVWANKDYQELAKTTEIIGVWDDHDYGKNDAGVEWEKKEEAQQLFYDFLKAPKDDPRRAREGVYYAKTYNTKKGAIKVILLDTRYFRTAIKPSPVEGRRYDPWTVADGGTILGNAQWEWLTNELKDDTADFTMIVTSIQFLADEHGWEKWGNHPGEVEKMYETLRNAKAKNIFMVSGDRHLAEFSVNKNAGLDYPLVDFTTSGLTHTFPGDPMDKNRYRVGEGTKGLNFGVLQFDFDTKKVQMEIRGENNVLLEIYTQYY